MNNEQGIETSNLWKKRICSDDMMFQTQSKSYEKWMKDEAWDFFVGDASCLCVTPAG
jgi:hypothetical protein